MFVLVSFDWMIEFAKFHLSYICIEKQNLIVLVKIIY